jgi:hypothetical protein
VAYLHKNQKKGSEPAKHHAVEEIRPIVEVPAASAESAPAQSEPPTIKPGSPHEYLRAARDVLIGREQHIEAELKRLRDLEAEKEQVRRELDAVNTALQVFGG